MSSRFTQFLAGVQAELPILIGVAPFGMIYGVLALEAGIQPGDAQAISAVLFAGSSQMILTQLIHTGTPALVMVLTIFVVNLRHALYSASLAPYVQRLPVRWKLLLSYLLTDEAYAVTVLHYETLYETLDEVSPVGAERQTQPVTQSVAQPAAVRYAHWFFLGAGLALWSTWQLSTAAGIFLGAVVPGSWSLDFTLALTFIALVVPTLKDRPVVAAALVAGIVSILTFQVPYRLGLILAALAGVVAGMLVEGRGERR